MHVSTKLSRKALAWVSVAVALTHAQQGAAQETQQTPIGQERSTPADATLPVEEITPESVPPAATAQLGRSAENAVRQAEDAFGVSIGRETIGIYNSGSVRGFSPTTAGNVRIEGLYFDQVWGLTSRLRRSTTIRVGLSAQGYPFPAPTGVVDYAFRAPGQKRVLSGVLSGDTYENASLELDAELPLISGTLSLGAGLGLYHNGFYNGTDMT